MRTADLINVLGVVFLGGLPTHSARTLAEGAVHLIAARGSTSMTMGTIDFVEFLRVVVLGRLPTYGTGAFAVDTKVAC